MRYFKLPDLGEGLPEAEIVEWYVKQGDTVKTDQIIVSVETAKAIVEVPTPCDGVIATLFGKPGDFIHTGEPLIEFEGGADIDTGTVVGKIESNDDDSGTDHFIIGAVTSAGQRETHATPAIRALAKSLGVDLQDVNATGHHGIFTHGDVERAAKLAEIHGAAENLRGVRRSMAQAMSKAHAEVARVTLHDDADINNWPKGSDHTMRLVRAVGKACEQVPSLNCWYEGASMRRRLLQHVDLGIAVDTPDGLFVPVLRDIRARTLDDLRTGLNRLRADVESRKIPPAELQGATITLSNFGTMAGRYADPIVVPPMVAIVGAGRVREEPVSVDGKVKVHRILPLSVSFDHRAVTGGEAARFLAALITDLERGE